MINRGEGQTRKVLRLRDLRCGFAKCEHHSANLKLRHSSVEQSARKNRIRKSYLREIELFSLEIEFSSVLAAAPCAILFKVTNNALNMLASAQKETDHSL